MHACISDEHAYGAELYLRQALEKRVPMHTKDTVGHKSKRDTSLLLAGDGDHSSACCLPPCDRSDTNQDGRGRMMQRAGR